jgi:hypothetical protein
MLNDGVESGKCLMTNLEQFILETTILAGLFIHYTIGMITMLYVETYRVNKGKDKYTVVQFLVNALYWPVIIYQEWKDSRFR